MINKIHVLLILYEFITHVLTMNIISDSRYTLPLCFNNNSLLYNQYGFMTMKTDILRENMTFNVNFDTIQSYSCYLCDKFGGTYCNTSIDANDISLSKDLSFNLMSIIVNENEEFPYKIDNHFMIYGDTITLPFDKLIINKTTTDCSQNVKIIVVLFILIQKYPLPLNFITTVNNYNDYPTQKIKCDQNNLIFNGIDCSHIGKYYYYMTYNTPSCIANRKINSNIEIDEDNKQTMIYTSLYWYKESLHGIYKAMDDKELTESDTLCGENWLSILKNSNMTMYCGLNAYLYVKMKPWYKMAIQYITTKLNIKYGILTDNDRFIAIKRIGMDILLSYDTLERSCNERDILETSIESTFLKDLYSRLASFNGEFNDDINITTQNICNEIGLILNKTNSDMDVGFLPIYLNYHNTWYFYYFKYLILYTVVDMETAVIAFLIFFALSSTFYVIFIFSLPVSLCFCYCFRDYKKKNTYEYIS